MESLYVYYAAAAVAGLTVCIFIVHALWKREGEFPEAYPYETTIKLLLNLDKFMEFATDYFNIYEKNHNGKKSFVTRVIGMPTFVFTNDAENITHILKGNFDNYGKGPVFHRKFEGLLGNGIFNVDGKLWYRHRKTSAHLFNLNKFKGVVLDTFNDHCNIVISIMAMKAGAPFDIQDIMHKFTLDSIGKIAFGRELGCLQKARVDFADDFDYIQMQTNDSFINPLWRLQRYFTPAGWSYFIRLGRINRFAYGLVRERRLQQQANEALKSTEVSPSKSDNDLISLYLERQHETGEQLSDTDLRDIIMNFVIAGRDTTAQALSWCFYRLCMHPDVQTRAREEVYKAFKEANVDPTASTVAVSYEVLQGMKYLEAFCMEVLRLHPSVPKELKYAFNDDVLPDGTKVKYVCVCVCVCVCMCVCV
jgi:cytochrome P450